MVDSDEISLWGRSIVRDKLFVLGRVFTISVVIGESTNKQMSERKRQTWT